MNCWWLLITVGALTIGTGRKAIAAVTGDDHWSYSSSSHTGPASWQSLDSSYVCNGSSQSPVAFRGFGKIIHCPWLEAIQFSGYDSTFNDVKLVNNGHTVVLSMQNARYNAYISGSGLDDLYELVQVHVHWGETDAVGSEHILGKRAYPCEFHLVHLRRMYYGDVTKAKNDPSGAAVLGVLCELSDKDNQVLEASLFKHIGSTVKYNGDSAQINGIVPSQTFLPENLTNYFRYQGSLTTPSCWEMVIWTVFEDTLKISSNQLAKLRNLSSNVKTAHFEPLTQNYRPVQPLNDRFVFYRRPLSGNVSAEVLKKSAASLELSRTALLTSAFATILLLENHAACGPAKP